MKKNKNGNNMQENNRSENKKLSPMISITTIDEDGMQSVKRIALTIKELSILKIIYENIMVKRVPDFFIESSDYRSLMNRSLVKFSQTYRNVILTTISETIIKSKQEKGIREFEGEEESWVVEWRGF